MRRSPTERKEARRALREDAFNLPNALTMARIVAIPWVLWYVRQGTPASAIIAAWSWGALAATDFLDGYLARKFGVESVLGKFLDPLADKLFVASLLIELAVMGRVPPWLVIILIGRELAVTGLRSIASSEGMVLAAGTGGKWKAALQMVGIVFLILHFPYAVLPFWPARVDLNVVGQWLMLISLVLSLTSGAEYGATFAQALIERERARESGGDG